MILDSLANWPHYYALPAWTRAFGWITSLDPEIAPGKYAIEGDDIYAVAFDFQTMNLLDTTLEAHRVYADIHVPLPAPLGGPEVHARFAPAELAEKTPYDAERDATQFHHPDRFGALFTLHPGQFALYLPEDAHLSQGKTNPKPEKLRKVVVKVRAELLRP